MAVCLHVISTIKRYSINHLYCVIDTSSRIVAHLISRQRQEKSDARGSQYFAAVFTKNTVSREL